MVTGLGTQSGDFRPVECVLKRMLYINESWSKIAFSVLATALELFGFSEVAIDRHYAGAGKSQIKKTGECFAIQRVYPPKTVDLHSYAPGATNYHDIIIRLA